MESEQEMVMDYEVKADTLEASFDAVERQGLPVERPVIAGGSAVADERRAFVDGFLRRGLAGAEMKSFVGTTGPEGGYAVPRELDSMVEAALKSISPIRHIANVVRVGTSNYRNW